MRPSLLLTALLALSSAPLRGQRPAPDTVRLSLAAPQLERPVEILRDGSGISHIYAQNEHDLFFAQGYVAATDRLFQLELWRRQATGTVAELLGP
ncbi:MAG TPA: penicillin acylase family protein, partial [Gemmatimonadaceae bacterium]